MMGIVVWLFGGIDVNDLDCVYLVGFCRWYGYWFYWCGVGYCWEGFSGFFVVIVVYFCFSFGVGNSFVCVEFYGVFGWE